MDNPHDFRECKLSLYTNDIEGVNINEDGVSNIASEIIWRLENEVFTGKERINKLSNLIKNIRKSGEKNKYDCVIGLSGGVDSSILAVRAIQLGLRPLAIHLDNGWNVNLAVSNIEKLVRKLGIDLVTEVVDWLEIRDLQRSYIKASLLDLECVSDHAINALLYRTANKMNIKYVLHGGNVQTESTMPRSWTYDKRDSVNLLDIHRKYGEKELHSYPYILPRKLFYYLFIRQIKSIPILNYLEYNKSDSIQELISNYDYKPYLRKHGENRFTRFFQEIYLPRKFGIDKRISHLSSLILSGEISKESAKMTLTERLYSEQEEQDEVQFIAKKLGFTLSELNTLINQKPSSHLEYKNASALFNHNNIILQFARYYAKGELNKKSFYKLINHFK